MPDGLAVGVSLLLLLAELVEVAEGVLLAVGVDDNDIPEPTGVIDPVLDKEVVLEILIVDEGEDDIVGVSVSDGKLEKEPDGVPVGVLDGESDREPEGLPEGTSDSVGVRVFEREVDADGDIVAVSLGLLLGLWLGLEVGLLLGLLGEIEGLCVEVCEGLSEAVGVLL